MKVVTETRIEMTPEERRKIYELLDVGVEIVEFRKFLRKEFGLTRQEAGIVSRTYIENNNNKYVVIV